MVLQQGTTLGGYVIAAPVGAGGMGEVYRARDARLERDVAVKVLPASLAHDLDALARFEREARAVAALSHPGILSIFDFGRQGDVSYAVMELLEGETLRARLDDGPLPLRKAIEIARQVAQALAAAHDKGIVHRDLKPENLFVTKSGRVKILDFGLAKQDRVAAGSAETNSPTVAQETDPGTILGTVGYMSPEQVRGRAADARSDIFSLGAVLYEMLAGRRAFLSETAAETMTAILRSDPPELSASGVPVPAALERVVRYCLEKQPDERFRSAHDLAFALDALSGSTASGREALEALPRPAATRARTAVIAAAIVVAALGAIALGRFVRGTPEVPFTAVRPLTYSGSDFDPAVSPDGRSIAFSSRRDGTRRIWLKQLATGDEVALTSGPDSSPRFSPDGSQLLFVHRNQEFGPSTTDLYRVPVLGGEPRKVAAIAGGGEWSPDGRRIVFTRVARGSAVSSALLLAPVGGGDAKEIARFGDRILLYPRFAPDGRTVAVLSVSSSQKGSGGFELVSLDGTARRSIEPPPTLGILSSAVFSPDGRSIFYAQSLSVGRGSSRLVRQDVQSGAAHPLLYLPFGTGVLDALGRGRLVADGMASRQNLYEVAAAGDSSTKRWLTRGTSTDRQPVFSPDGQSMAFSSDRSGNLDIWTMSMKTGALHRITEDEADDWDPAFTRDGRLVWSSGRTGHLEIWTAEADGSAPRRVTDDGGDAENATATPDGWIVYWSGNEKKAGFWKIRSDGSAATRFASHVPITPPDVSPDGRYVAYTAAGAVQVLQVSDGKLLPFRIRISRTRQTAARLGRVRWTPDGRRILFLGQNEKGINGVFSQEFDPAKADTSATRLAVGGFDPDVEAESFAISPDGSRLVVAALESQSSLVTIEGVLGLDPAR